MHKANNIVIYTDGCSYQNRCVQISNCLLLYTKLNTKFVVHKYLCKGHTQMEVDSVHTVIERALRNQNVYSPAGYVDIIRNAKKKQSKYEIKYLDFIFFHEFKAFPFYTSIRPGRVAETIVLIKYVNSGTVMTSLTRYDHSTDEWSSLSQRINRDVDNDNDNDNDTEYDLLNINFIQ